MPLRFAPEALSDPAAEREAHNDWLAGHWRIAAAILEFARGAGLMDAQRIDAALAAAEGGDARSVHGLLGETALALELHLQRRLQGCPAAHGAADAPFLIELCVREDDYAEHGCYLVASPVEPFLAEIPIASMPDDLAGVVYRALLLVEKTWGISLTWAWQPGDLLWALDERMTLFAELDEAVRGEAAAFHRHCVAESDYGLFCEGADSVEGARLLLAELNANEAFAHWIDERRQAWGAQPPLTPETLRAEADALRHRVDVDWQPWVAWAHHVSLAAEHAATDITPASPAEVLDDSFPIDLVFQADPGAPWIQSVMDDVFDHAAQAGEMLALPWPLLPENGAAVLAAVEQFADFLAVVLAIPGDGESHDDNR